MLWLSNMTILLCPRNISASRHAHGLCHAQNVNTTWRIHAQMDSTTSYNNYFDPISK